MLVVVPRVIPSEDLFGQLPLVGGSKSFQVRIHIEQVQFLWNLPSPKQRLLVKSGNLSFHVSDIHSLLEPQGLGIFCGGHYEYWGLHFRHLYPISHFFRRMTVHVFYHCRKTAQMFSSFSISSDPCLHL